MPRFRFPGVVAATLLVAACSTSRPPTDTAGATAPPAPPPVDCAVAAVREVDGRTMAELPAGSRHGVETGAFLRFYDAKEPGRLKGMLQVTEVAGPDRSLARIIAASEKGGGIAAGDLVVEVRDLGRLTEPAAIERAARDAGAAGQAADDAERDRFAAVREQYLRELAQARARHERELADLRSGHTRTLDSLTADHAAALDRERLKARTDVAALQAGLGEAVTAAVLAARAQETERTRVLTQQRDALRTRTDALAAENAELARRLEGAVAEQGRLDAQAAARLRAERELREELTVRLGAIEARSEGRPSPALALLSQDPQRDESILERLARLDALAQAERAERERIAARLAETQAAGQALASQVERLNGELVAARAASEPLAALRTQVQQLTAAATAADSRAAQAERDRTAGEVARLEAERALYDLAARVLRLPQGAEQLQALVRAKLGAGLEAGANP
jgi:hypothetical protein